MNINDSVTLPLLIISRGQHQASIKSGDKKRDTDNADERHENSGQTVETGRGAESMKTRQPSVGIIAHHQRLSYVAVRGPGQNLYWARPVYCGKHPKTSAPARREL